MIKKKKWNKIKKQFHHTAAIPCATLQCLCLYQCKYKQQVQVHISEYGGTLHWFVLPDTNARAMTNASSNTNAIANTNASTSTNTKF